MMGKPLTGRRLLVAFAKHVCEWNKEGVQAFLDQAPSSIPRLSGIIDCTRMWCERQDKDWYDIGIELKWYPDPPEAPWAATIGYGSSSMTSLGNAYARTPQTALMRAAVEAAILEKELAKKRSKQ